MNIFEDIQIKSKTKRIKGELIMVKKLNRVSVAKFEKAVNKDTVITVPLENVENVNIEITKSISLQDMIEFVENVAESCVDMESGEYTPQVRDFAIKRELLTKYANFTMPNNIEKQYEFIYGSDVVDTVVKNINQLQFQEIISSIDRKIKFMLDCVTSISAANTVKLIDKLDSIAEQNTAMFDSLQNEDIVNVFSSINAIANMDEEKLAKAVKEIQSSDKD